MPGWRIRRRHPGRDGRQVRYLGSVLEVTLATELGDIFVVSPDVEHWWQPGDKTTLRLLGHGISVVAA